MKLSIALRFAAFVCLFISRSRAVNVLLIIVDDLRPALGCYGDSRAHTPHLDRLASQSVLFERAYAQQALCGPSRNSLLTSRRPWSLRLYDTHSYWRESVGNFSTMPQYFKERGYKTAAFGKVFHPGRSSNYSDDSPYSWTEPVFHPYTERFKDAPVCGPQLNSSNLVCPVRVNSMPNATLPDIEILNAAKAFLRAEVTRPQQPFFLAVGFHKPHIPLTHPRRYLRYHPMRKFRVPSDYEWPRNLSHLAYNPWMDLRRRNDVKSLGLACPWQKIPRRFARSIMRSYYAAVTYVDDLIGELLDELELVGLRDESIVALTSDHGWSLGEHAEWAKYSNFEVALRVPLLISAPGRLPQGTRVSEPVELLDLFPSLAELAGLPVPTVCPPPSALRPVPRLCTQGSSLLRDRKGLAVSLYPRAGPEPHCEADADEPRLRDIRVMGYSVRSVSLRYTAWLPFDWRENRPDWAGLLAEELYDHKSDPGETNSVADSSEYRLHKQRLQRILIDTLSA